MEDRIKLWVRIAGSVFFVYAVFVLLLVAMQRNLQYFPDKHNPSPAQSIVPQMLEVDLTTHDGMHNESWMWLPEDASQKVIVFFHGNAAHHGARAFKAKYYLEAGMGMVLVGYRGYGGNRGYPYEDGLYYDARAVMDDLLKSRGIALARIVLYGESLGTGVAVKMAQEHPDVAALVLEAPFDSALAIAKEEYWYVPFLSTLMKDQYRSDLRVSKLPMKKLFLLAGKDEVLPVEHGKRLFQLAAEPKEQIIIPQAHHGDMYNYGVAEKVIDYIRYLP